MAMDEKAPIICYTVKDGYVIVVTLYKTDNPPHTYVKVPPNQFRIIYDLIGSLLGERHGHKTD